MVEHKVEPVEETVQHAPAPNQTQNHQPAQNRNGQPAPSSGPQVQGQCGPASSAQTPESTSSVRNKVLERVVAQQQQRISQLERQVDKRKETFWRLSNSPPFIPPPGLGILPHVPPSTAPPPGVSAPASPAVQSSQTPPDPAATATDTTNATQQQQQQKHQSQPLAHNPAMAATMAAMTAASTRPVPGALHPQYPFFPYPHPDSPVIAPPFMGVVSSVPSHPMPPRMQPSSSTSPSRANQASEDGGNRQSRYWTPDEHQRYLAAVNTFGPKNYQQIAEVVGTRNAKQVRTHSQKFQKKLEREEARRRGDPRIVSDVQAAGQAQVAEPAVMSDGTSGHAPNRLRQSDVHRGGPATASSKSLNPDDTPPSAKSVDGSSSTNNTPSERKGETNNDSDHEKAKAAAAAAVAAEAVALGYGRLPSSPNTTANELKVGNSLKSGSKLQKRWPVETKRAKANGHQGLPTHTDANLTDTGKASPTRNHATSHPVILPSPRTNASTPRFEAKGVISMPGGRGAESHQLTDKKFGQKLRDCAEGIASNRRPTPSSVNASSVRLRIGPEKRQVAKLMPSAVKIEPRIVPAVPNSGTLQVSCPTAATISQSRLTILPATGSSNPEITTANEKSSRGSALQADHKPVEGARNCLKTDGASNEPVTLPKEATALAHRKSEAVPNGQHGTRSIHQRDRQEVLGVPKKLPANKSSLPAASKKVVEKVSTPAKKPGETCHARDPSDTSGNGNRPNESYRIASVDQKTVEQRKQQSHVEKAESGHSNRDDPQTSDRTNGVGANNTFAIQKKIESEKPAGVLEEYASIDEVAWKNKKVSLRQKGDFDSLDLQIKQKSTSNRLAGQIISCEVTGSRDSFTGTVKGFAGQPSSTPVKKLETTPTPKELVMKKRSHADDASGGTEQDTRYNLKNAVKEAQIKRQCCNSDGAAGDAPDGQKNIQRSTSFSADARKQYAGSHEAGKEAGGRLSCKILNGQADLSVGVLGAALHGAAGCPYEEEKSAAQETNNTMQTDKTDVMTTNGRRTEKEGSEEEATKANVKRSLDSAAESIAKRLKGGDDGNRIHREDEGNYNEVKAPQKP